MTAWARVLNCTNWDQIETDSVEVEAIGLGNLLTDHTWHMKELKNEISNGRTEVLGGRCYILLGGTMWNSRFCKAEEVSRYCVSHGSAETFDFGNT